MISKQTLTLIIRLLEECLEQEYSPEELRSKIRDILKLLGASELQGFHIRKGFQGSPPKQSSSYEKSL